VTAYFEHRRRLTEATMRMHPGELVSEGEGVAQFVTGSAVLDGDLFDRIWS